MGLKRELKFVGLEMDKINITKAVLVNVERKFFYLEEYKDNEYRLTWSKGFYDGELSDLTNIEVIRANA